MLRKIFIILKKLYNFENVIKINNLKINYEREILNDTKGYSLKEYNNEKKNLIVSLTTYSKRIFDVHLTIQSLFSQTIKPNKIILWLAKEEFNDKNIPLILKKLENKGLEIKYCKDLKSYKKLIPTLEIYPKDSIITVDDDIIYPYDFIEKFYKFHKKYPKEILFTRGSKFTYDKNGEIKDYTKWDQFSEEKTSFLALPTGIGGILYPPESLDLEVLNEEKYMELAPRADDLWFKAMALKKGSKCLLIKSIVPFKDRFLEIDGGRDIALSNTNNGKTKENNIQLKNVFDYYNLWGKIKE